ncbi:hypothetical protein Y032_0251g200 [Ancylostoma ceylanicum]|uniref:Uncharacterized protein n=1 Tax=Ancylostoma ceylanicum TaxID=53326 RepID=A0A016SC25_9BILA|nr:hypothetical protein Y032_0251g200 [Ancylostoma ceylanicum]
MGEIRMEHLTTSSCKRSDSVLRAIDTKSKWNDVNDESKTSRSRRNDDKHCAFPAEHLRKNTVNDVFYTEEMSVKFVENKSDLLIEML